MLAQEGMTPEATSRSSRCRRPTCRPRSTRTRSTPTARASRFGAAAQRAGYARPLRMTRDEWRNYICCVLTVREELIAENRAAGAGSRRTTCWARASGSTPQQENRDKAVAIAAGRSFFNQDPNILRFVMENPTDRVTYGDLRMIRAEFEELMQLSIDGRHDQASDRRTSATWTRSFARAAQPAAIAL